MLQIAVGLLVLSFYHPWMLAFSALLIAGIVLVVFVLGRRAVPTAVAESKAKYDVFGWLEELARHPATFRDADQRDFARGPCRHAGDRLDRCAPSPFPDRAPPARRHARAAGRGERRPARARRHARGPRPADPRPARRVGAHHHRDRVDRRQARQAVRTLLRPARRRRQALAPVRPAARARGGRRARFADRVRRRSSCPDVDFGYGPEPVFSRLDAAIEPGARLALAGASGSGKSSLLELLFGLREPRRATSRSTAGTIASSRSNRCGTSSRSCAAARRSRERFARTCASGATDSTTRR